MSYNPVSEVVVTVGGSEGIDIAMRAMLNPGDEVLIPQPSYVSYLPCAMLADGVPVAFRFMRRINLNSPEKTWRKRSQTGRRSLYFRSRIIRRVP